MKGKEYGMERELEENEVWEVVRKMKGDKAPGPDGFSMAFFQTCWEVVKKDMIAVFKEFHESRKFEKSINATFVALIPKEARAVIRIFALLVLQVGSIK
jgi:hypothetical protein